MPTELKQLREDSTLRNAFIRVTHTNNTKEGIIQYTKEELIQKCRSLCDRYNGSNFYFINHNRDIDPETEQLKNDHSHIVFTMKKGNKIQFKYLKEIFPYGHIERPISVNAAVQYLLHLNDFEKTPYSRDEIVTNAKDTILDELLTVTDGQGSNSRKMIDDLIRKIDKGEIREYNRFEFIDSVTLARNEGLFKNAFKNRSEKIMSDFNRKIDVYFIQGTTGSGKTTYAKMLASKIGNGSYYVSSSSNDSLQDYKGQDVLILDDLRDTAFEFADILKMLDNHTASSVKSRFYNKTFLGKAIFITTTDYLYDWYKDSKEDKNQFYRRISAYIQIDKDRVTFNAIKYNEDEKRYIPEYCYSTPNPVTALYKIENEEKNDKLNLLINLNKSLIDGIDISDNFRNEFNNAINKAIEEQKQKQQ